MYWRFKCLGLALLLLVLVLNETNAYQPVGNYDNSGLSAAQLTYGRNTNAQLQQQQQHRQQDSPRDSACPANFKGLKPYPHDCHRFVNCDNGHPVIQSCGPGTAFHPETLVCDHEGKVPCGSPLVAQPQRSARLQQLNVEPKCAPGVNGLEAHPYDCTKFLQCANGQTIVQNCGPGTAFHPTTRVCDFKHKVNCGDNPLNGGGRAENEETNGSYGGLSCPPGTRGLLPHPHDTNKYLKCGYGVQPTVEQCQLGQVFDGHSLTCVSSSISSLRTSDLHCPNGVDGLFVHPFDQTKYLNCKAGNVAVQSCPASQVFSIFKSYCHPKDQLVYSDYVAYIVSEISYEYSLRLTRCPAGTTGLHLYPYDAAKYIQCAADGTLSILSCDTDMSYSISQRACRSARQLLRSDRVKFLSELVVTGTYSYTDSQAFQSSLTACPRSLQGKYAHPFNAAYFVLCQNGLLQVESCPRGSFYSLSKRSCSTAQQLALHEFLDYSYTSFQLSSNFMQDLTTVTCPANAQGYFLHPFDCTKYLNCRDQQTSIESCDQGKIFSISQRHCVGRDQLESTYDRVEYLTDTQNEFSQENVQTKIEKDTDNINTTISCPYYYNGIFAHPYDCSRFVKCVQGETTMQDCPPGTAFSETELRCNFIQSVDCGKRHLSTDRHVTSSHNEANPGVTGCAEGTRGLRPHPSEERKYLRCGIGVQPIVEECPLGEVFEARTLTCVSAGLNHNEVQVSPVHTNDLLCPVGIEGLFVHPFDQTKFLHCKIGKLAIQNCIPNTVFSISKRSCEPKADLSPTDYVGYIVSKINHEESLILTHCPSGIDGFHLYPYDGTKYVRCAVGGHMFILSCAPGMAFSLSQRLCRPIDQLRRGDFYELIVNQATNFRQSTDIEYTLSSCPHGVQGKYAYPFNAAYFVSCVNGRMQVESCPRGSSYSLSKRSCSTSQPLALHECLDYSYTSFQLSSNFMQDLTTLTCPENAQGYFLHPFDCTKYINCRNQRSTIESCEQDHFFSISQRQCVASDQLQMAFDRVDYLQETRNEYHYRRDDDTAVQCPENVYGLYANPFDARSYFYCEPGRSVIHECPSTDLFSISHGYCMLAESVQVNDHVSMIRGGNSFATCPSGADGNYVYPFDCTKFLSCEAGVKRLYSCPKGNHFSVSQLSCQPEEQVQRSNRVYLSSELKIFYDWWQQLHEGADLVICPVGFSGIYQHPRSPNKFLSCSPGHQQAEILECANDMLFDIAKRICVPRFQMNGPIIGTTSGYDRESKSYEQYPGGSGIKTTTINAGDRWSNMNMQRPAGIGFGHADPNPRPSEGVYGEGSSYNRQSPTQSVLFVEGSLQPNRNYPQTPVTNTVYKAPLAPMASTPTSKVYYAQPVDTAETRAPNNWNPLPILPFTWNPPSKPLKPHYNPAPPANHRPTYNEPSQSRESGFQPPTPPTHTSSLPGQQPLNLDYDPAPSTDPKPIYNKPTQWRESDFKPPTPPSHTSSLPGQQSLNLDYDSAPPANHRPTYNEPSQSRESGFQPATPPTHTSSLPGQQPLNLDYDPTPSANHRPTYNEPSQRGQKDLKPLTPPNYASSLPGQQPLSLDYEPSISSNDRSPPFNDPSLRGQQPIDLEYNPDDDHQSAVDRQDSLPSETQQQPSIRPDSLGHPPTQTIDESNLYGGLQPPAPPSVNQTTPEPSTSPTQSNVHTYPIYPAVANSPSSQKPNQPHYSRSYSGVAHSRNSSWHKSPARAPNPFEPVDDDDRHIDDEYDYENPEPSVTSTAERRDARTPKKSASSDETPSLTDYNEAMLLLLHPFGNSIENSARLAESALASVIKKPITSTTTPTSTSTFRSTPLQRNAQQTPDDDVELIVAGEQESLETTDDESVVSDVGETGRTEHTISPTTETSSFDTTDYSNNPKPTNWYSRGHSREFHLRHPNMPDPFDKPAPQHNAQHPHHFHHFHHNHQHHFNHHVSPDPQGPQDPQDPHDLHDHHDQHEHSRLYHDLHPNIPNPFVTEVKPESEPLPESRPKQEDVEEFMPNPNAEAITPRSVGINYGSRSSQPCDFDCGTGKCVKQSEVCNGFNNCGNRKDEQDCDHLGYQLRLSGGEGAHMGRVEVKVNGQWGYVCDDSFGLPDADVVCHELGYKMGAAEVHGNSYYEPSERTFNYLMDGVDCRGNETKLKDCDFKGWGVHNCGVDEVVGVVCKVPLEKCPPNMWLCLTSHQCLPLEFVCDNTEDCADKSDESDAVCKAPIQYRLEGGRGTNEGRLEVKYHGVWGSVCDDDFNMNAAQVACNSLGYYGRPRIAKNIFGPGSGPIWLDQVMCLGNETSIDNCRHWNWGEHNCNHTEDISLSCTVGPRPKEMRLRTKLHPTATNTTSTGVPLTLSDIGFWERSSKALHTPRRCGIFKDDLIDEFAHPEQRVVKGSVARRGRHPWQATIRTRGRGGISSHWCGAVVISKRHLLTAAHCVHGRMQAAYFVRVGDHYANIAENSEMDAFIETWYIHEQFRKQSHMNNDIAVVVLKTPLRFSDYVQPICLPERGAPLVENRTCTISGWGSIKSGISTPSQELRAAQLPILPDATCKQMNVYGDAMTEGMFCAGSMDESVDACEGDSGGPLVCSDEDGETLYGIISWGQHCGYQNRPGVYVRVCHYIDWIYEKINQSLQRF